MDRAFPEANVAQILDILEEKWGMEKDPPYLGHDEPLDGLILTVLSQNTNDRNRDTAFARLKEEFPTWAEVYEAGEERLIDLLRPAGLANIKAGRIINILQHIKEQFGAFSLKELEGMSRQDVESFLGKLPGIGPKTIACVLIFDLGIPAFPVDTHVARFCRRIGWVEDRTSPDKIQKIMEGKMDPSRFLGAHINIITHGRNICHARNPKCNICPLYSLCPYGKEIS
jgi:endonuclease-3